MREHAPEDAWERLNSSLNSAPKIPKIVDVLRVAVPSVVLGIVLLLNFMDVSVDKQGLSIGEKKAQIAENIVVNAPDKKANPIQKNSASMLSIADEDKPKKETFTFKKNTHVTAVKAHESKSQNIETVQTKQPIGIISKIITIKPRLISSNGSQALAKGHEVQNTLVDDYKAKGSGLYAGITGGLSNTWFTHSKDNNAPNNVSAANSERKFGTSYGISMGYNLSKRFAIHADWLISVQKGNHYKTFSENEYRQLNMQYTQFNLIAKHKRPALTKNMNVKASANYFGGGYFGILKGATAEADYGTVSISQSVSNNEFGLVFGMEYEAVMNNKFGVTAGLTASSGLKNIFTGNIYTTYEGQSTTQIAASNTTVGLHLSVNYLLSYK